MSLKTRTVTGLSFGAIMIFGCYYSNQSCTALFLVISLLCLWELSGHILVQDSIKIVNIFRRFNFVLIGSFFPFITTLRYVFNFESTIYLFFFFPVLAFSLFLFELFGKSSKPFDNLGFIFLGVVYLGLPFSLLIWIANTSLEQFGGVGNQLILAVLFMVWASDVFAYLLGSKFGKHKMFPRISPNKTWEGTISGVLGAIFTGYLCSMIFLNLNFQLSFWIGLACVCTVFGILGDLVESMLKRSLGIKDSGNLLPGHGGFLDRFDAFIFVIPFVFTYFSIFFILAQ